MTQLKTEKIFFPNLDGLRFFCFLGVFCFHSLSTNYDFILESSAYWFFKKFLFANGNLGVNFFFVLSGFLITYLLIEEKRKFHGINIRNFYIRRILRIWPLFFFCVLFGFFVFPAIKSLFGEIPNETATIKYYLVFLNNFEFIEKGLPDSSVLGVLWSVAIEEQFYLVWPVLLTLVPLKHYWKIFSFIIIASFLFRLYYANSALILEYHSFSCISDMTIGACFALMAHERKRLFQWIVTMSRWKVILLYVVLLATYLSRQYIFAKWPLLAATDRLFYSILFGLIIVEQTFSQKSIFKMGRFKLVSKLGTYTYGLYCLHMIGILVVAKTLAALALNNTVFGVIFIEPFASFWLALLLALASYHLFEKHFLKLKDKFARIVRF